MIDLSHLIGIPFQEGGNDKYGIDCYHLAQRVFAEYGRNIPGYRVSCSTAYNCGLKSDAINRQIDAHRREWVRIKEPIEPCLVVLRSDDSNPELCSHVGVFIGDRRFIHVMRKIYSCIQKVDNPIWANRIEGYYIYNG